MTNQTFWNKLQKEYQTIFSFSLLLKNRFLTWTPLMNVSCAFLSANLAMELKWKLSKSKTNTQLRSSMPCFQLVLVIISSLKPSYLRCPSAWWRGSTSPYCRKDWNLEKKIHSRFQRCNENAFIKSLCPLTPDPPNRTSTLAYPPPKYYRDSSQTTKFCETQCHI